MSEGGWQIKRRRIPQAFEEARITDPALVVAIAGEPACTKSRALAASQAFTRTSIPSPACNR
jgi:hypothetical protein